MPTEQHIFSTGLLTALWSGATQVVPESQLIASRGGTAIGTVPIANLTDGNVATAVDFATNGASTNSWQNWAVIDLGKALDVTSVTISGAASETSVVFPFAVYAASSPTLTPGASGTSQIGTSQNAETPTNLTFSMGSGLAVNTRYLLVGATNSTSGIVNYGMGDVSVTQALGYIAPAGIAFAVVQEAQIEMKWDCRELFTASSVSEFPIDIGVGESSWKVTIHNIGVRADALQKIVAAQLSVGSTDTLLLPQTISMPSMSAVFNATDTLGGNVEFTLNNAKANGAQLPFKLNDFVVQEFNLMAYPDQNGVMGTIAFSGA